MRRAERSAWRAAVVVFGAVAAIARTAPIPLAGGALLYEAGPSPFKAYVKEWSTRAGVQFLLDSPADHPHHHGLMFAVNVGPVEFGAEQPAGRVGRQVGRVQPRVADEGLEHLIEWRAPDGVVMLVERRHLRFQRAAGDRPDRLSWSSELRPPEDGAAAMLTGRHYTGLGLRFVRDLDGAIAYTFEPGAASEVVLEKGTGRPPNDERLTGGRWVVARGRVAGRLLTVAIFGHGSAQRGTRWFTMSRPFAFVGATLDLHREPWPVRADTPLRVRWQLVAWNGQVSDAAVVAELERWAADEATQETAR
ncbi:MAG: PmoA family protein [Kiritimatiellae bacterium]|nr:PmoA family protein [Kiritimatiellia bacterium]